jgi:glutamyl-Q tRNA(Asp) synthetase
MLQHALGLPTPSYMHTPLVLGENGEKLSKQNGAEALDLSNPLATLNAAAALLNLATESDSIKNALTLWLKAYEKSK